MTLIIATNKHIIADRRSSSDTVSSLRTDTANKLYHLKNPFAPGTFDVIAGSGKVSDIAKVLHRRESYVESNRTVRTPTPNLLLTIDSNGDSKLMFSDRNDIGYNDVSAMAIGGGRESLGLAAATLQYDNELYWILDRKRNLVNIAAIASALVSSCSSSFNYISAKHIATNELLSSEVNPEEVFSVDSVAKMFENVSGRTENMDDYMAPYHKRNMKFGFFKKGVPYVELRSGHMSGKCEALKISRSRGDIWVEGGIASTSRSLCNSFKRQINDDVKAIHVGLTDIGISLPKVTMCDGKTMIGYHTDTSATAPSVGYDIADYTRHRCKFLSDYGHLNALQTAALLSLVANRLIHFQALNDSVATIDYSKLKEKDFKAISKVLIGSCVP